MDAAHVELSLVTYNVRGVMDRWPEREPLLAGCLRGLDADVVAFQEVLTGEFAQDARLLGSGYAIHECRAALATLASAWAWAGAAYAGAVRSLLAFSPTRAMMVAAPAFVEGLRERYSVRAEWARSLRDVSMAPFFGNSIATRASGVGADRPELLLLGSFRAAQRVRVVLQPGRSQQGRPLTVWVVNTHLDHSDPQTRAAQAGALCAWMERVREGGDCAGVVVAGDLNAPPAEEAHRVFARHGFVSAYQARHGAEPKVTWPTGLQAPLMDEGDPHCADYVYVWHAPGHSIEVLAAELCGDRPSPGDATLYPSDHAGIRARLRVTRMARD